MGLRGAVTRAIADTTERVAQAEQPRAYVEPDTPFAGFAIDASGKVTGRAPSGPHLWLLAGSGAGKSRRVLVPSIATHDGPVCAVSAKGDLIEYSAALRARRGGRVYVMDLAGEVPDRDLPEGAVRVVNDPCALLLPDADGNTDDSALDLANLLLQVGSLGLSNGSGGGGGDSAFWMTLAVRSLAALLQAGGWYRPDPDGELVWGGGIDWVLRAAIHYGKTGECPDEDEDEEIELDWEGPDWDVAARRAASVGSSHADDLGATKDLDDRQRDSVGINLRVALSSWQKRAVRGDGSATPFHPSKLEDPTSTLYLVSPSSGSAAGAATSVVESLVAHWKLNVARKLPRLAMVIDECPQICPIPRLAEHVGLMRSYGVAFTVAAQASSQFEPRWGSAGLKILRDIFPAILIGIGAPEKEILDQAAWMQPPSERRAASHDAGGRESLGADRAESFHSSELLPRHQGEGRLLVRGRAGALVRLVDFSKM